MAAVLPLLYAAVAWEKPDGPWARGEGAEGERGRDGKKLWAGACARNHAESIASLPDAAAARGAHQRHAPHVTNTPLPPSVSLYPALPPHHGLSTRPA